MVKIDWADLAARAGWTALQGVLSLAVVELASLPTWWALLLMPILSVAKTYAVGKSAARKAA
jgi:hypothetical protein